MDCRTNSLNCCSYFFNGWELGHGTVAAQQFVAGFFGFIAMRWVKKTQELGPKNRMCQFLTSMSNRLSKVNEPFGSMASQEEAKYGDKGPVDQHTILLN